MEDIEKVYELQIKRGREHRSILPPDRINSPTEFFYNAYQDAKYQLREIVLASTQNKIRESKELTTKSRIELLHEYPNNVIAFCADRGRGKTTAMLSFSNALETLGNSPENSPHSFWDTLPDIEKPLNARFEVIAPIDPASMENTESVLQQIISLLFENFCRKSKDRSYCGYSNKNCDRDALAEKFQQCAQAIDALYKSERIPGTLIEDELDKIAEIGQSGKLLLLLHELTEMYLDYMQCSNDPTRCLVIQIDDADMDIGRSYQILEDVRKYLGLPRVIILMATNLQQLETTVEQHFLKEYECGLKYGNSMITVERCHEIAVLCLEKAIPHPRRIYLPDIGETIRQHLSQLRVYYQEPNDSGDSSSVNLLSEYGTYQEQLLELLYQKTGMVFTFERDYLHNLLPAHMRELCQFLPFFYSMDNVSDGYKIAAETFQNQGFSDNIETPHRLNQWEANLKRLEFYLVNLWSAINLREGSRNLFREFVAQPESVRNLYLLRNIGDYYVRERVASESGNSAFVGAEAECRKEFVYACSLRGINLDSYLEETVQGEMSVSYADVMGALAALTDLPGANRQYKFAYAIRLFCSIRLHIALIQEIRMIGNGTGTDGLRTLTALMRDALLKSGLTNDTKKTPFGFWRLEMPVQWFAAYNNGQDSESVQVESPFLRRKYIKDHMIRMVSTIECKGESGVRRSVGISFGKAETDIVVFSPLYPLLDALDRFVYFQNTKLMEDTDDIYMHMSQIYVALLVCLNWDVQRVLFKKIKNQAVSSMKSMAEEVYTKYITSLVYLIPGEKPRWLSVPDSEGVALRPSYFDNLWGEKNQELFDILITRVHPVTEFKSYIQRARDGLSMLDKCSISIKEITNELAEENKLDQAPQQISVLWETARSCRHSSLLGALRKIDEAVLYAIMIPPSLNEYLKLKLGKRQPLYMLLSIGQPNTHSSSQNDSFLWNESDILDFSLEGVALTIQQIRNALNQYIMLLKMFLDRGPDWEDNKSPQIVIKTRESLPQATTNSNISPKAAMQTIDTTSDPAQVGNPETAIKALQGLLQLGQQLLSAMTLLQQNALQANQPQSDQQISTNPKK